MAEQKVPVSVKIEIGFALFLALFFAASTVLSLASGWLSKPDAVALAFAPLWMLITFVCWRWRRALRLLHYGPNRRTRDWWKWRPGVAKE